MITLDRPAIEELIDFAHATAAIEEAFRATSAGRVNLPPVGHIEFPAVGADCHIKYGHVEGDEYFELYRRYIEARHRDGDMYPPSREQYESFLSAEWGVTQFFRLALNNELVGVAVADRLTDGLSAIYTFYDPDLQSRSLGTFSVLWQIEATRALGLDYLYLGYWIKDCQKMAYKIQFRPLELFVNGQWVELL